MVIVTWGDLLSYCQSKLQFDHEKYDKIFLPQENVYCMSHHRRDKKGAMRWREKEK